MPSAPREVSRYDTMNDVFVPWRAIRYEYRSVNS